MLGVNEAAQRIRGERRGCDFHDHPGALTDLDDLTSLRDGHFPFLLTVKSCC